MSESKRQCEVCHVECSARRGTARFCGGTCRQQANRAKANNAARKSESLFSSILEQQNKLRAIVLEAGAEYFPAWRKTPTVRMKLMAHKIASEFERMLDQTKRSIQDTMQAKIDKERENYNRHGNTTRSCSRTTSPFWQNITRRLKVCPRRIGKP